MSEAREGILSGLPVFEPGWVWLVGAGPGDPGLLTLHALNALKQADVVIYDALVDKAVLEHARRGALIEYAGKRGGKPSPKQRDISLKLIAMARAGKRVCRLKGGDPFVFGRGGEEALALNEAGIEIEVVPGVSSIAAVPAVAGIPVTHRGLSDRVTIASCHGADGSDAEYARLAAIGGTLILFMGLSRVERVVDGLIAAGLPRETPAAAISRGSLPDQEVARAALGDLAAATVGLASPTLLVIGDVAALELLEPANIPILALTATRH
jgi:uroporphyrin-III C-methyltransferase